MAFGGGLAILVVIMLAKTRRDFGCRELGVPRMRDQRAKGESDYVMQRNAIGIWGWLLFPCHHLV